MKKYFLRKCSRTQFLEIVEVNSKKSRESKTYVSKIEKKYASMIYQSFHNCFYIEPQIRIYSLLLLKAQ
jgi:hypothetical protein